MYRMAQLELIAACAMGLEAVVARELKELGYTEQTVENGRVIFRGDELAICRANLWLRTADRILIRMGQFRAVTFDELFEGTKALDWPEWIPEDAEFPVEGRSHKSQLSSVPACQGIVKKAVVEKMKQRYGTEWFRETGARYVIEVSLLNDIATLTLDTTGPSLHKRGYRKLVTEAPLKETLAAALVLLSRWRPERPLYDPFCGSGTLPIEAAMIGWNVAPGLRRAYASEAWPAVPRGGVRQRPRRCPAGHRRQRHRWRRHRCGARRRQGGGACEGAPLPHGARRQSPAERRLRRPDHQSALRRAAR
jgi:putative N6-adenine-specific DNA methylase